MVRRLLEGDPDLSIVGEAADGKSTVELCGTVLPDVLLLDISMPGMNGIEAARIISSLPTPPRIVTLSMHADAYLAAEILGAGASAYLTKDCDPGEVTRAVRAVMKGQTYLSSGIAGPVIDAYIRKKSSSRPHPGTPGPEGALSRLSQRERQVFREMALGFTPMEISKKLGISHKTVETHRSNLLKKLALNRTTDLVRLAIREGLIDP
jgi:DNA-binding NarL/FixJ family response regulator